MKAENLYSGITNDTKELFSILREKPIGISLSALGKWLSLEYSRYSEKEVDGIVDKLHESFKEQRHSGGSALVCIQQLFDAVGARCLDDEGYKKVREEVDDDCKE